MTDQQFVLYTYQSVNSSLVCHAYGLTDQATAQAEGTKLQEAAASAQEPFLGFMVLPLEDLPNA